MANKNFIKGPMTRLTGILSLQVSSLFFLFLLWGLSLDRAPLSAGPIILTICLFVLTAFPSLFKSHGKVMWQMRQMGGVLKGLELAHQGSVTNRAIFFSHLILKNYCGLLPK